MAMEFIAYVPGQAKQKSSVKLKQKATRKAEGDDNLKSSVSQKPQERHESQQICLRPGNRQGKAIVRTQRRESGAFNLVYLSLARNRLLSKYGAFVAPTFDAGASGKAVATADFMGTCVWPVVAGHAIASSWFQDFCTMPVLYHAQSAASSAYRDLMANEPATITSPRTSFHKMKALQLVQDSIGDLPKMSTANVQKLIFAILILGSHEATPEDFVPKELPFKAYFPEASLINLWGRISPIEAHDKAAFDLIERYGGLGCMQEPGLTPMASLVDILRAATNFRRPRFPLFFDANIFDMSPAQMPALLDSDTYSSVLPGRGFARIPGGLPPTALSVFTQVACLDRLMNHLREKGCTDAEFGTMLTVRNATLHRLLSLPAWKNLKNKGSTSRTSYELCRITCVIYCNAVLFYIPPHTGWNAKLTRILQDLLSEDITKDWKSSTRSLYLLSLFIGVLAAHDTPGRSFFEAALEECVNSGDDWSSLQHQFNEFVWSEHACGAGARQIFDDTIRSATEEPESSQSDDFSSQDR